MGDIRYSRSRAGDIVISRREETPIEDCESLRCAAKKSVSSSSTARSGELEEETEVESLAWTGRRALAIVLRFVVYWRPSEACSLVQEARRDNKGRRGPLCGNEPKTSVCFVVNVVQACNCMGFGGLYWLSSFSNGKQINVRALVGTCVWLKVQVRWFINVVEHSEA